MKIWALMVRVKWLMPASTKIIWRACADLNAAQDLALKQYAIPLAAWQQTGDDRCWQASTELYGEPVWHFIQEEEVYDIS